MLSAFPSRQADPRENIRARVDVPAVLRLLTDIERLHAGASGAFVIGAAGHPEGTVLVEDGRVCWAGARGMSSRMTDLLRHQADPPLDGAQIEAIYGRCRAGGKPLGEALVESGLVSPDGLRRALRQHTVEALAILGTSMSTQPYVWVTRGEKRYDARFTFTSVELLLGLGAMCEPAAAVKAHPIVVTAAECGLGAAFVRSDVAALPVPVAAVGLDSTPVATLVGLGRWTVEMLDLANVYAPTRRVLATSTPTGEAFVAWSDATAHYVVACESPTAMACAIVRSRRGLDGGH